MKKLFTLALMVGVTATAFAQRHISAAAMKPATNVNRNHTANKTTIAGAMLFTASFLDTTCFYYNGQIDTATVDSGYVGGTNKYGDLQKLMLYNLNDFGLHTPANVDTIKMLFAAKAPVGNGLLVAHVYDSTGALLGTSNGMNVANVDTSGHYTSFTFTAPVALTSGNFFVSLDLTGAYTAHDSVALYTQIGCSSIDTNQAWDELADTTFLPASSYLDWAVPVSYAIFPVIDAYQLGINNVATTTFAAKFFPNPATATTTLSFVSPTTGNTQIQLKDITGKTVINHTVATVKGQSYDEMLDISNLNSGLYFCEIISGTNRGVIKVTVQ